MPTIAVLKKVTLDIVKEHIELVKKEIQENGIEGFCIDHELLNKSNNYQRLLVVLNSSNTMNELLTMTNVLSEHGKGQWENFNDSFEQEKNK